jgi:hypothetical protein
MADPTHAPEAIAVALPAALIEGIRFAADSPLGGRRIRTSGSARDDHNF